MSILGNAGGRPPTGPISPSSLPLGSALGTFNAATGLPDTTTADGLTAGYAVGTSVGAAPIAATPSESYFTATTAGTYLGVQYAVGDYLVTKDDGNGGLVWNKEAAQAGFEVPSTILVTAGAVVTGSQLVASVGTFVTGDNILMLNSGTVGGVLYQAGTVLNVVTPFSIASWSSANSQNTATPLTPHVGKCKVFSLNNLRGKLMLAQKSLAFTPNSFSVLFGQLNMPSVLTLYTFDLPTLTWVVAGQQAFNSYSQKRQNYLPNASFNAPNIVGWGAGKVAMNGIVPTGALALVDPGAESDIAFANGTPAGYTVYWSTTGSGGSTPTPPGTALYSPAFTLDAGDYSQLMDLAFDLQFLPPQAIPLTASPATNTFGLWINAVVGGVTYWIPAYDQIAVNALRKRVRTSFQARPDAATYRIVLLTSIALDKLSLYRTFDLLLDNFDVSAASVSSAPAGVVVKGYLTANQAGGSGNGALSAMTTVRNDMNAWDGAKLVAPIGGVYQLSLTVCNSGGSSPAAFYQLGSNPTLYFYGTQGSASRTLVADTLVLNAGDVVYLGLYVVGGTTYGGPDNTYFSFTLLQAAPVASTVLGAIGSSGYLTSDYAPPLYYQMLTAAAWTVTKNDLGAFVNGAYTAPAEGWYMLTMTLNVDNSFVGYELGGEFRLCSGPASGSARSEATTVTYMRAGDVLHLAGYFSGNTIRGGVGGSANGVMVGPYSFFSIARLPNAPQATAPQATIGSAGFLTANYTPAAGNQALTAAPWTVTKNDLGAFAAGTYTAPSPGWYQLHFTLQSTNSWAGFAVNGVFQLCSGSIAATTARVMSSAAVYLNAGDRLQLAGYFGGGVVAGGPGSGTAPVLGPPTYFSILRLP